MRSFVILMVMLLAATTTVAEVVTETVTYRHDGTVLEGYLARPADADGPRPGVLVIHQWMGPSENERMRARMLAELGYVALAADVYGQGIRPATPTRRGSRPPSTTAIASSSAPGSRRAWPS